MIVSRYFNGILIGIMVAFAAGGLPTLATTWRDGDPSRRLAKEPGFSVGLVLTYVPIAYGVGGLLAVAIGTSNALVNSLLVLALCIGLHADYLLRRKMRSARRDIGVRAGITDLFESGVVEALRASCTSDLAGGGRARLVAPNLRELFEPGMAMGSSIIDFINRGMRLDILTDGSSFAPADLNLSSGNGRVEVIGVDAADSSRQWLILSVGKVLYFGLLPEGGRLSDIPVCRGLISGDQDSGQVVQAVQSVLDSLFERARSGECHARVATTSSPKLYRERIVPAEAGAQTIERIPKRLSVVFKGEETVRAIAEQRFGSGSPSVKHYVDEHRERRAEFFAALRRGMVCREIYNEQELVEYVRSGAHGSSVVLDRSEVSDTVLRWRQAIELYDDYIVALTADPIPFKYELIDGRLVSLHEAIGVSDLHRLNAIFVEGRSVGESFLSDFETIWERVPPDRRSKAALLSFIDKVLIPLTAGNGESKEPDRNESGSLGEVPSV
jgi:hypothetical protein